MNRKRESLLSGEHPPMLNETAQMIAQGIEHGWNILIIGPHGIGKTQAVRALVEQRFPNLKARYLSLSQMAKDDIMAPFPVERHGKRWLEYILLDIYDPMDSDGVERPIVLIMDEFNRNLKDSDIYNALLEVFTNRSLCGRELNLHSIVAMANPTDNMYFNTAEIETAVLDRFDLFLYVNGYDLGADIYLLEHYPDYAPGVIEWYYSLPEEKRGLFPPRRQEKVIRVYQKGIPIAYAFPRDTQLPLDQLQSILKGGRIWTLDRLLREPKAAVAAMQSNLSLVPLFVALMSLIPSVKQAKQVIEVFRHLQPAVRYGLYKRNPKVWYEPIIETGDPIEEEG